ncbi:MAG: molecular chaperone DnaK, partial [Clostridia bacterium]
NMDAIKEASEKLTKVFYEMSEKLYKKANPNGEQPGTTEGTDEANAETNNGEKVYDADYKVEEDDKNKENKDKKE